MCIFFCFVCRVLSSSVCLLSGVDLPRRAAVHSIHHAPLHHFRGPLPQPALPDEVREEQDMPPSHPQNRHCVGAQRRHESTSLTHVLSGKRLSFSLGRLLLVIG